MVECPGCQQVAHSFKQAWWKYNEPFSSGTHKSDITWVPITCLKDLKDLLDAAWRVFWSNPGDVLRCRKAACKCHLKTFQKIFCSWGSLHAVSLGIRIPPRCSHLGRYFRSHLGGPWDPFNRLYYPWISVSVRVWSKNASPMDSEGQP